MTQLCDGFWLWLFDRLDRDSLPRYSYAHFQAEYGISQSEYALENREDALKDAQEYFGKRDAAERKNYVEAFTSHCVALEEDAINMAINARAVLEEMEKT